MTPQQERMLNNLRRDRAEINMKLIDLQQAHDETQREITRLESAREAARTELRISRAYVKELSTRIAAIESFVCAGDPSRARRAGE